MKSQEEKTTQLVVEKSEKGNELHKTYADMLKGSCAEVVQKVSAQIASLPSSSPPGGPRAAGELAGALDDYMDKEKRKSNIVVHNLPESNAENQSERADCDAALFKEMIKDEMKLQVKVQRSFRVGKKNDGKARLLIVTLESPSHKHDILRLAPQLRHSTNYINIYIFLPGLLTWLGSFLF